jgi:hypothetical protein
MGFLREIIGKYNGIDLSLEIEGKMLSRYLILDNARNCPDFGISLSRLNRLMKEDGIDCINFCDGRFVSEILRSEGDTCNLLGASLSRMEERRPEDCRRIKEIMKPENYQPSIYS